MIIRTTVSLAKREFVRFIRQPQRVIGAVGQPLLFWLFLGSGFSESFRPPGMEGMTYLEFFYPGVLLMMLLFASIFSSITVIEDRDQGFLQGVLVAPVPRIGIVLGKVIGSTLIAMVQCLMFLIVAYFLKIPVGFFGMIMVVIALIISSVGFSSLGFMLAWGMKSTSGFHAIMMVFMMPLWMLSGALFPLPESKGWLKTLMDYNPVHHAWVLIREPFYMTDIQSLFNHDYLFSLTVVGVWVVFCLFFSMVQVNRQDKGVQA